MPLARCIVPRFIHIIYTFYLTQKKENPFRCLIKYFESASPELGRLGDGK